MKKSYYLVAANKYRLLICVLGLVASLLVMREPAAAQNLVDVNGDGTVTVMGFGDSITHGIGDGTNTPVSPENILDVRGPGYLGRLASKIGVATINAAVPGERISSGVRRLISAVGASRPDYVIIIEGANDAIDQLSIKEYRRHLQRMANVGRRLGSEVVLATLTQSHGFREIQNSIMGSYSVVVEQIATGNDLMLVPVRAAYSRICPVIKENCELLHSDGLHPKQNGHDLISEVMIASFYGIDLFAPEGPEILAQSLGVTAETLIFR